MEAVLMVVGVKNAEGRETQLSAQELLEKFRYGHSDDVERILRFASDHQLEKDNLVFLLVSILKGNEELIRCLLEAIVHAERAIGDTHVKAGQLQKFTQQLIGQVEAAANRAAGHLNVAADRLSGSIQNAETLSGLLIGSSKDLQVTSETLRLLIDLPAANDVAGKLWMHVSYQAREYLRQHGQSVIEEIRDETRKDGWFRHVYGIANLIIMLIVVIWAMIR